MKPFNDWAELVTDPEWSQYLSENHIPLEAVQTIWEEAQNSLLLTKNCKATDTFTDPRDEKVYKTIKIGDKIWMAENLAYEGVDRYCPDGNEAYIKKYGYLYTWENAKRACPEGWRLPTEEEYLDLIGAIEYEQNMYSSSIRDSSWEHGSNTSGFSALPAGYRYYSGDFYGFGPFARFWSSTPNGSGCAYCLYVNYIITGVAVNNANDAFSVRCVKDD